MRIIEKGCDPSIKLAKFKFNCDSVLEDIRDCGEKVLFMGATEIRYPQ